MNIDLMNKVAVITGADGGMGIEITRAVAAAGYRVLMLCHSQEKGELRRKELLKENPKASLTVISVELSSMRKVTACAEEIARQTNHVDLLMNNAGTMNTCFEQTEDGFEYTVAVNYLAPFLLTNKLLDMMPSGGRIVNMVSCTYAVGSIGPHFFRKGREGSFWRIPVYSNTKLALWLFTRALSLKLKNRGITVNASDPGIVSTPIIRMDMWFDPITDLIFRPLIRTPRQGADTAIRLLLNKEYENSTGCMYASAKPRKLKPEYLSEERCLNFWKQTEEVLSGFLSVKSN